MDLLSLFPPADSDERDELRQQCAREAGGGKRGKALSLAQYLIQYENDNAD